MKIEFTKIEEKREKWDRSTTTGVFGPMGCGRASLSLRDCTRIHSKPYANGEIHGSGDILKITQKESAICAECGAVIPQCRVEIPATGVETPRLA